VTQQIPIKWEEAESYTEQTRKKKNGSASLSVLTMDWSNP